MKRCRHTLAAMLLVSLLITAVHPLVAGAVTPPVIPQDTSQSTTGPVPPPGVAPKLPRVFLPGETTSVLASVPGYSWRHGCGPTAIGMVIGYYDGMGFSDLIPGDASTQTAEVDQALASEGGGGAPRHYEDYSLPLDDSSTGILPDRSEAPSGDEHADDSIADFMFTSQSVIGNYYGWSYGSHVDDAFISYIHSIYPDAAARVVEYSMFNGTLTWDVVTDEIDAGRPMVFLVDSSGDGNTDHFVTVVGYSEYIVEEFACLDTWYPPEEPRWCEFLPMASGRPWGVYKGWSLNPDETYLVGPGGGADYADIQDAIDVAGSGARISVEPGIYTGARNRDLDFGGKALRLVSLAGADSTIIECEGLGRAFNFHSQEVAASVVDGFTIRNGFADNGGGIRCFWNSSPTLRNLSIEGCSATGDGGGIWIGAGSVPSLTGVTIVGCDASHGGGVHCNGGSPTLDSVTLHGNCATDGGGVSCAVSSSPVLQRTIVSGSTQGGALYCAGSDTPSLNHCCIYGNAGGDSLCGIHSENLFVRPRFCEVEVSDLTLRDDSPCLPENNIWGELIGAHELGSCVTGIAADCGEKPTSLALHPASPNPSEQTTAIAFDLPAAQAVTLAVFDVAGRLVRTLAADAPYPAGRHQMQWDGRDDSGRLAASGVYFFRLAAGEQRMTGRVVILR